MQNVGHPVELIVVYERKVYAPIVQDLRTYGYRGACANGN
jgi:hypothetical protein